MKKYSIIFVNSRKNFFDIELEKNGLFGIVDLYEFNLNLIPLESDLFSLELPPSSSNIYRYETYHIAKALWQLQSLYGQIPTSFCLGNASEEVNKILK